MSMFSKNPTQIEDPRCSTMCLLVIHVAQNQRYTIEDGNVCRTGIGYYGWEGRVDHNYGAIAHPLVWLQKFTEFENQHLNSHYKMSVCIFQGNALENS